MKKKLIGLAIAIVALVPSLILGSCKVIVNTTDYTVTSVTGQAVNVQALGDSATWYANAAGTSSLVGASIYMVEQSPPPGITPESFSTTVASNGSFSFGSVRTGEYLLSGTQAGWNIISRAVTIAPDSTSLPPLLAYQTTTDIMVIVSWENLAVDVDSYMVRDTTNDTDMNADGAEPIAGYIVGTTAPFQYYDDPTYGKVFLDRDVIVSDPLSYPRVECIRVTGPSGAVSGFERLRYYLRNANQTGSSLTGGSAAGEAGAKATVFVVQGSATLGTYNIAFDSAEQTLGVVQMGWDMAAAPDLWTIGSYANPIFTTDDGSSTGGFRAINYAPVVVSEMK